MSARQPKRALLVIDVQNEYVSGNLRIEFPAIQSSLERIGAAMDAAHAAGIPIVVVQHLAPADSPLFARGSRQAELHEVVASRPYQHKVEKQLASSFVGTGLADWLRERDIDTLAVVGYMTQHCDDSTIRQAIHEGWQVEYLHDASGSVLPQPRRPGQRGRDPPDLRHRPAVLLRRRAQHRGVAGKPRRPARSGTRQHLRLQPASPGQPLKRRRPRGAASAQPTSEPRAGNGFQPGNSRSRGSGTAQ